MTETKNSSESELFQDIHVICPTCQVKKALKIPTQIINQSKKLTTVSIPSGAVCEHSFQSFVDKDFKIRGYQKIDFEFTHIEFYEGGGESIGVEPDDPTAKLRSMPLIQEIINALRNFVDDKEILGSGMFTIDGHVLYSSLPSNTLSSMIKEFEVRSERKLSSLKKMFLELENKEKLCSNYVEIHEMRFALVLFFSRQVKLGMANLYLNDLVKHIRKLED